MRCVWHLVSRRNDCADDGVFYALANFWSWTHGHDHRQSEASDYRWCQLYGKPDLSEMSASGAKASAQS